MPKPVVQPEIKTHPMTTAVMKEDMAAWRTESASGETDLPFDGWLKATRPDRWRVYLKATGQGQ